MRITKIMLFAVGITFAAFTQPQAFAQSSFEGTLTMHDSASGKAMDMTYYYKGDKVRIETAMKGKEMAFIEDHAAKTTTLIMSAQKMYMTQPFTDTKPKSTPPNEKPIKTGKTETILGYTCEEWTLATERKGTVLFWLAHGMPSFLPSMGMDKNGAQTQYHDFFKDNGYPIRMTMTDSTGNLTMRMEAVKIEKKPLDASLFLPPADYKQFSAPSGAQQNPMGMPRSGQ